MTDPCEAILERAALRDCRPSRIGATNGCFYCSARIASGFKADALVAKLNDYDTGETFRVSAQTDLAIPLDPPAPPGTLRRFPAAHCELFGSLPLIPADWFPNLSMRDTFVIDELCVWFLSRGLSTTSYFWRDADFNEIIRTLWAKKIPITPAELVQYLANHGLPPNFHERASARFDAGMDLLTYAVGKPPIKKKRLKSFDNFRGSSAWYGRFVEPVLGPLTTASG